jgi:ABC-type antimicrobial peptide transport system permease subunit
MAMVVRAPVEPSSLTNAVRAAIHEVDPDQPLYDVSPMATVVERTLRGQWFNTMLIAAFAVMALALTSAGLYGVVSYLTAQRRREFGIRLALGATASDVLTLALKQGLGLAGIGLVAGLTLSAMLTRALGAMLHQVTAWDPATYLAVSGLLIVVMVAATVVPAWHASRLDPKVAVQEP